MEVMGMLRNLYEETRRVVFPHFCFSCGKESGLLCGDCSANVSASDISYANPVLRKLLHAYKYEGIPEAGDKLAALFQKHLAAFIDPGLSAQALVIPMPLHPLKERLRGFNQTEILARAAAQHFGYLYTPHILKRKFVWRAQASLENADARKKNAQGTFFCASSTAVSNRDCLLIDDVRTTGATADEAANVLFMNGARAVKILPFLHKYPIFR